MAYKRTFIDIADLYINIENPRFEMVGNQREAIKTMIEDQGDKLCNYYFGLHKNLLISIV